MLKRSGQARARVSEATIRRISQRRHIRAAFVGILLQHLSDLGLNMSELDRGGYGLIRASVLEGAPPVTAKKYIKDVLSKLEEDKIDFDMVRRELEDDVATEQDDE
jgi:hypothetical protein